MAKRVNTCKCVATPQEKIEYKTKVSRNSNMSKLQAGYLFPEDTLFSYLVQAYSFRVMRRSKNLNDRNSQKFVQFVTKTLVYEGNAMRLLMGEESHYSSPRVYNRFSVDRSFARTTCPLALGLLALGIKLVYSATSKHRDQSSYLNLFTRVDPF
ncbi:unnamed protein product [Cochlearia groenlandica]